MNRNNCMTPCSARGAERSRNQSTGCCGCAPERQRPCAQRPTTGGCGRTTSMSRMASAPGCMENRMSPAPRCPEQNTPMNRCAENCSAPTPRCPEQDAPMNRCAENCSAPTPRCPEQNAPMNRCAENCSVPTPRCPEQNVPMNRCPENRTPSCSCEEDWRSAVPTGCREKLLRYIDEVSFAAYDALLFLDSHPRDEEALCYFREHNRKRNFALNEYARLYGPLNIGAMDDDASRAWEWACQPWPWEGGNQ